MGHEQTSKSMPKDPENGAQIDAKTHQKPMPKVIAKKCVTIIEKRVFSQG